MDTQSCTQDLESIFSEEVSKRFNSQKSSFEIFDTIKVVSGRAVFIKSKEISRDCVELPPGEDYKHSTAEEIDKYVDNVIVKMLLTNIRQISSESRTLAATSHRNFRKIKDFSAKKDLKLDDLRLELTNYNVKLNEAATKEKKLFLKFLDEKDERRIKEEELKTDYEEVLAEKMECSQVDKKTEIAIKKNEWKTEQLREISKSLLVGIKNCNYLEDEQIQYILCDGPVK